jgi:hypothetical protein
MLKNWRCWLACAFLAAGCAQNEEPAVEKDYFPLKTGMFWEYQVDETSYTAFAPPASSSFQLRIVVADSVPAADGGFTYVLHRYVREDESAPWQFLNTWSARKYAGYALVAEGNTLYAKLAFPVYLHRAWNGNLFNQNTDDTYRIAALLPEVMLTSGLSVVDVAEVEQENVTNNLTYRDVRSEWYAHAIGLVQKKSEVWTYRCGGGTCTGEIESGHAYRQVLTAYGSE